jgi:hypothetical protein
MKMQSLRMILVATSLVFVAVFINQYIENNETKRIGVNILMQNSEEEPRDLVLNALEKRDTERLNKISQSLVGGEKFVDTVKSLEKIFDIESETGSSGFVFTFRGFGSEGVVKNFIARFSQENGVVKKVEISG